MVGGALGWRAAHCPVRLVMLASLLVVGCATSRVPSALRGYDVVVDGKDEQSVELARAMRSYGYRVRERLRGGSRPTAVLIHFTFSDPGAGQDAWLHIRLADTRSGVIVAAGTVRLDSLAPTPQVRAKLAVQSLASP